jgi:hypothetical protein
MCALVLYDTYPQVIHNMWGLIFTRGQDVVYLDHRYKLYERFRGEGGLQRC